MKKFGMVIAIGREVKGVLEAFGKVEKIQNKPYDTYLVSRENALIYVAVSGMGEISAAGATEFLIAKYDVRAIFNFGFVGTLTKRFGCKDVAIVEKVVHYEIDTSAIDNVKAGHYDENPDPYFYFDKTLISAVKRDFPKIKTARLASGDKFISSSEVKDKLIADFDAEICDMEGAGICIIANKNGVPALSLKIVSDNADETSPADFNEIADQGTSECAKIIVDVIDAIAREK